MRRLTTEIPREKPGEIPRKRTAGLNAVLARVCTVALRICVGVAFVAPGGAQAQDWWLGAWAYDPDWCAQVDQIGSVTPAPIAITETQVLGYENTCAITAAQELYGANAVHLLLSCQSQGDTYDEERVLMNTDETAHSVWIWFGSGDPQLFQRCQ